MKTFTYLSLCFLILIAGCMPKKSQPESISDLIIYPQDDAYIRGGQHASTNFGKSLEVALNNSEAPDKKRYIFFKFPLSKIENDQFLKAQFSITLKEQHYGHISDPLDSAAIALSLVTDDQWNEETINFENHPAIEKKIIASLNSVETHHCKRITFDLTEVVLNELNRDSILSFVMYGKLPGDRHLAMWSKDVNDSSIHPELKISYTKEEENASDSEQPLISLLPEDDAYVHKELNETPLGNSLELAVNGTASDQERETFIKFNLTDLQKTDFSRAELHIRVKEQHIGPITTPLDTMAFKINFIKDDTWNEQEITWENKPQSSDMMLLHHAPSCHCDILVFDLTKVVKQELKGDKKLSIQFKGKLQEPHMAFWSKDVNHEAVKPYLKIFE